MRFCSLFGVFIIGTGTVWAGSISGNLGSYDSNLIQRHRLRKSKTNRAKLDLSIQV